MAMIRAYARRIRSVRLHPLTVLASTAALAAATVLLPAPPATADASHAGGSRNRPTAVVGLGDSFVSGESAGDYEDGSDTFGRYCHRSRHAAIRQVELPGIDRSVNLACSGATTRNVRLGGTSRYGEPPQAEQLRTIARDDDVRMIVLTLGTNDIPFTLMVLNCISAYFGVTPACAPLWDRLLPNRLAALQPRIERVLTDIQSVMRKAGYAKNDYQLILQSYTSPVPPRLRFPNTLRAVHGCPFRNPDMRWARQVGIPRTNQHLRQAARAVSGVRFLDLTAAFDGRQICAPGISHQQEWIRGVSIELNEMVHGIGPNLVQQSLHPNKLGQAQLARCLREFSVSIGPEGRCAQDRTGNLRLVTAGGAAPHGNG